MRMSLWLIILSVIFSVLQPSVCQSSSNVVPKMTRSVCMTQACREIGAKITASMNATIDPCEDFYEFACGRWASANPKPKFYKDEWNNSAVIHFLTQSRLRDELQSAPSPSDIEPIKQMKQFYKSCMDEKASETDTFSRIQGILHKTGGWPMLMDPNQRNTHAMTWRTLDDYYSSLLGHSMFYTLNIISRSEFNVYSLVIQPQVTFIGQKKHRKNYEALMKRVIEAFIHKINATVPSQLQEDIDDLIAFEKRLHAASRVRYIEKDVEDLEEFIPEWNLMTQNYAEARIDWQKVFHRIFVMTNCRPSIQNPVAIRRLGYFVKLARILQTTRKRTIINYIHWKFLASVLPYATQEMADLFSSKIDHNIQAADSKLPHWLYCVERIGSNYASYSLFIRKYYQRNSRQNADDLYRELLHSWEMQVDNSNWLSRRSKHDVKLNVYTPYPVLGYSDFYDNDQNILEYFEDLQIGDSYFKNIVNYWNHMWKRDMMFWGMTTNSKENLDNPLLGPASFDHQRNSIIIPASLLQSPLLDGTLPNYVAYSTVGHMISHEMSQSLDYKVFSEILTNEELTSYDGIIQCLVDRYDHHFRMARTIYSTQPSKNPSSRGEFTRNENIADWNGLQIAFQAYKRMKNANLPTGEFKIPGVTGFTNEEMFFLLFAQSWCSENIDDDSEDRHAPNYLRVNGVVSNNEDFSAAYGCSRDSPMHPANKCNIWME